MSCMIYTVVNQKDTKIICIVSDYGMEKGDMVMEEFITF